ncbi:MFS transporter [Photobacterium sp. WH24]|uniref:MFS transporter n=1 Tax=Photobacterium sp. WH24 TaxID=2827237 RepID=UPI001C44F8DB|nr:MFS transporter [Photobacterium sp. WH24]MBV7262307.1 MFS transporter [Photobacterium sp. WH24]
MNVLGTINSNNIKIKYYTLIGLYRFVVTMKFPILTLFLLGEGFSIVQIGMGYTIMSITVFCSDVPLGILADKINKKIVFILGILIESLSSILFKFSDRFEIMIISFILWGIGISNFSGVLQGWIVNSSNKLKLQINQSKVFSNARVVSNLATFLGMVISAVITTKYGFDTVFYIMFAFLLFYALLSFLIIDYYSENKEDEVKHSKSEYMGFLFDKNFIFILFFNAVLGFVYSGYAVIWMPIFEIYINLEFGEGLVNNTVVYGLSYLVSGLSLIYIINISVSIIPDLTKRIFYLRALFSISFLLMGIFVDNTFLLVLFTFCMFIFGDLEYGSLSEMNNSFFSDSNRVFGLSVLSSFERLLSSMGAFVITIIYESYSATPTLMIMGIVAFFPLFLLPIFRKSNNQNLESIVNEKH